MVSVLIAELAKGCWWNRNLKPNLLLWSGFGNV